MKKPKEHHKKYQKICERREEKKNKRKKRQKKKKHFNIKSRSKDSSANKQVSKTKKKQSTFESVVFPQDFNFSFVNNTEKMLKYFGEAKEHFNKKQNVNFDLSKITRVTPDAVALYIALMTDDKFVEKKAISGNMPEDTKLVQIFLNAGFYNYVNSAIPKGIDKDITYNLKTSQKADPKIAKDIAERIVKDKKYKSFYKILIELMSNTHNHADPNEEGRYHWCFHGYHNKEKNVWQCTFIDVGVGIFESTPVKEYKSKNIFSKEKNDSLLKKVLSGDIKKKPFTRIDKKNRGKGLPFIYKAIKSEEIYSTFIIISNDVSADINKESDEKLNKNFSGTFYYWEIKL